MDEKNVTRITSVHLLGFHTPHNLKVLVFFIFLMIYCISVCGNLLIITMVFYSKSLHSPMYFFLSQLSVSDILLISDILPSMLHIVLVEETIISFSDCIFQFYIFAVAGTLQCLLLTAMSYDRYLAICKPLHYYLIMSHQLCWIMAIIIWTVVVLDVSVNTFIISQLQFCGPNIIDHFFCDHCPVLQLSCSDTTVIQLVLTLLSALFVVIPFFIIIISYVCIIVTIFEIPSIIGRQKVFSTCSSHLTVVFIYYGTLFCVYLIPSNALSWNISKFLPLLYTVVTPLMNPIIYSLRNKDFKNVLEKMTSLHNSVNSLPS